MENLDKTELIREILTERLHQAENSLRGFEEQLEEAKAHPEYSRDPEYIGAIQHPIGYMTAVKHELELTLSLMGKSREEIQEWLLENDEAGRKNELAMEELKEMISMAFDELEEE